MVTDNELAAAVPGILNCDGTKFFYGQMSFPTPITDPDPSSSTNSLLREQTSLPLHHISDAEPSIMKNIN